MLIGAPGSIAYNGKNGRSGTGPKEVMGLKSPWHHLHTVVSHIRIELRHIFICSPVVHTASNILFLLSALNVHLPIPLICEKTNLINEKNYLLFLCRFFCISQKTSYTTPNSSILFSYLYYFTFQEIIHYSWQLC